MPCTTPERHAPQKRQLSTTAGVGLGDSKHILESQGPESSSRREERRPAYSHPHLILGSCSVQDLAGLTHKRGCSTHTTHTLHSS